MLFEHIRSPLAWWGTCADVAELQRSVRAANIRVAMNGSTTMDAAQRIFRERGLVLHDMPYDGSCFVWSLLPAIREHVTRRPTTLAEARHLLVDAMMQPRSASLLAEELVHANVERAAERLPPFADTHELLASFRRHGEYLPAILAAQAIEFLTRTRVQLLTIYWSIDYVELYLPVLREYINPDVTRLEARRMLVDTMLRPQLVGLLPRALVRLNTKRAQEGLAPYLDDADMIAAFRGDGEYLPTLLAVAAIEFLTKRTVEELGVDANYQVVPLYESEAGPPFTTRFYYEQKIRHAALLTELDDNEQPT
jgi:hypothetical protein